MTIEDDVVAAQPRPPIGFITDFILRIFDWAKWLSVMKYLSLLNPIYRPRSKLIESKDLSEIFTRRRAFAIDLYITVWFIVELIAFTITCCCAPYWLTYWSISLISSLRVLEIVQVTVNATVFDALNGRPKNEFASRTRTLVVAGVNFIELLICFGIIYAANYQYIVHAGQPITGLYLSVTTQLTLGYGDVYPRGWLRVIAAVQGLVGATFIILVFGRIVGSFSPIKVVFEKK